MGNFYFLKILFYSFNAFILVTEIFKNLKYFLTKIDDYIQLTTF